MILDHKIGLALERLEKKWGFNVPCSSYVPDGWYNLVDDLIVELNSIEGFNVKYFDQIKEKFGGLRIYTNGEVLELKDYDKINTLINRAEERSFKICSQCGMPGRLRVHGGWYYTSCEMHEAKR